MSELPVPQEQGATTIDFRNVTVIGISGSGITSINGDGTPAQILSAGPGITIVDGGGGAHVISVTGGGAITSINGDTTAAQTLSPALGSPVVIADSGGGAHTFTIGVGDGLEISANLIKWKRATGVLITGGFGFTGLGEVFIDAQAPLFLNTALPPFGGATGRLGLFSEFGIQTALGGPPQPLVLDGTITFRQFDNGGIVAGTNHNVATQNASGYFCTFVTANVAAAAAFTITGFDYSFTDQRSTFLLFHNLGDGPCTFKNENVGSLAQNRILTRGTRDLVVPGHSSCLFVYDDTFQRYRPVDSIDDELPFTLTASGVNVPGDETAVDLFTNSFEFGVYHVIFTVEFPSTNQTGSMYLRLHNGIGGTYAVSGVQGASSAGAVLTRALQISAMVVVNAANPSLVATVRQNNSGVTTYTTTANTTLCLFKIADSVS